MSIQQRRRRERDDRRRLILRAARELAQAEGWDAVTVRRLAERIEYSQPVLYSHFAGKEAIVSAVAVEGFAELAAAMRQARTGAIGETGDGPEGQAAAVRQARTGAIGETGDGPEGQAGGAADGRTGAGAGWAALARAYTRFAEANPALYQAMFTLATDLPFARPEAPEPLKAGFAEIYSAVLPLAGNREPGALAEVAWAALHGLVTLNQAGRFEPGQQDTRLALVIGLLLAPHAAEGAEPLGALADVGGGVGAP